MKKRGKTRKRRGGKGAGGFARARALVGGFVSRTGHFPLPRFVREMKKLKIGALSGGNRLRLIVGGDECYREFASAIRSARRSVNLETYIFNSDDVGWMIAKLLAKKAKRGVEVNVIYDAVGCLGTDPELFRYLEKSGVELLEYHPLLPWKKFFNLGSRDHRKVLVVDGRVAFVGGMNIGNEYAGKRCGGGGWRDTHLRIEGPAAGDVQFFFMENWFRYGGAVVDFARHFPEHRKGGSKLVMLMSSRARRHSKPIRQSYLTAIRYARESICITSAYFIPDGSVYRALVRAARRGVDVKLLLPGKSDLLFVIKAGRYLYRRYLKNGIRVFEYAPSVLHAKTAVIDGVWSTIGSSNIDHLSFSRNLEINAIVLDQEFGREMERMFARDLVKSAEVTLDTWARRSPLEFLAEWFFYRFRKLM
ncbi:MAG TPA: cardiolipin synthase [Spirochaetota bacterium]|nr:cardiolipin synthase [Spirochaetota bacterium]